jgi:thiamine biosynthesis lipoprotein
MTDDRGPTSHLEIVMGTVVGITSPDPLPSAGLSDAVRILHDADRIFSLWNPRSPMSRLRAGTAALEDLDPGDAQQISSVLADCALARELTGGAFDPWSLPGGVDPTGLVKGWAADRALRTLVAAGSTAVMINAGGDIAVAGRPHGQPWRVGLRHPAQPHGLSAIVEVDAAVATSGDYERPGQLIDPTTGRPGRGVASATVTGPDLGLADALATGLAIAGRPMLRAIDRLDGYDAHLITDDGRHFATPGLPIVRSPASDARGAGSTCRL